MDRTRDEENDIYSYFLPQGIADDDELSVDGDAEDADFVDASDAKVGAADVAPKSALPPAPVGTHAPSHGYVPMSGYGRVASPHGASSGIGGFDVAPARPAIIAPAPPSFQPSFPQVTHPVMRPHLGFWSSSALAPSPAASAVPAQLNVAPSGYVPRVGDQDNIASPAASAPASAVPESAGQPQTFFTTQPKFLAHGPGRMSDNGAARPAILSLPFNPSPSPPLLDSDRSGQSDHSAAPSQSSRSASHNVEPVPAAQPTAFSKPPKPHHAAQAKPSSTVPLKIKSKASATTTGEGASKSYVQHLNSIDTVAAPTSAVSAQKSPAVPSVPQPQTAQLQQPQQQQQHQKKPVQSTAPAPIVTNAQAAKGRTIATGLKWVPVNASAESAVNAQHSRQGSSVSSPSPAPLSETESASAGQTVTTTVVKTARDFVVVTKKARKGHRSHRNSGTDDLRDLDRSDSPTPSSPLSASSGSSHQVSRAHSPVVSPRTGSQSGGDDDALSSGRRHRVSHSYSHPSPLLVATRNRDVVPVSSAFSSLDASADEGEANGDAGDSTSAALNDTASARDTVVGASGSGTPASQKAKAPKPKRPAPPKSKPKEKEQNMTRAVDNDADEEGDAGASEDHRSSSRPSPAVSELLDGLRSFRLKTALKVLVPKLAAFGVWFVGLVLGFSWTLFLGFGRLHVKAAQVMALDSHCAFCFSFLYSFPYIVSLISGWAPPWTAPCLFYAFLMQVLCTQGPFMLVGLFRLVLPMLFLTEGVSHHTFLTDLNGGERIVLAFLVASFKTQEFYRPTFMFYLSCEIITALVLGGNIFVQWCLALLSLLVIHEDESQQSKATRKLIPRRTAAASGAATGLPPAALTHDPSAANPDGAHGLTFHGANMPRRRLAAGRIGAKARRH